MSFQQLLLIWAVGCCISPIVAQNSPFPSLGDYGGSSLQNGAWGPDSTFCKGQSIYLKGQDFATNGPGETFDSVVVHLGTISCPILAFNPSVSGNNDGLIFEVPDIFAQDTCLPMTLVKYTSGLIGSIPYAVADTICLTGDIAEFSYADSVFCLGDSNPSPIYVSGTDSLGIFSSPTALILPNGEIPLHPGALGIHQIEYITTHPECPDSLSFQIRIAMAQLPLASYGNTNSVSYCPVGTVVADTALLWPKGGSFSCSNPGLVILDDSLGQLNLGMSLPGRYALFYTVPEPCFDSAFIEIEILAPDSVGVNYPVPYFGNLQRVCQSEMNVHPVFQFGPAGGTFTALPNSLSMDSVGVIDPSQSPFGNYSIMYVSPGACPDTVAAALNFYVDSIPDASFEIFEEFFCPKDSVVVLDSVTTFGYLEILNAGNIIYSTALPSVPVAGLLSPGNSYVIQHTVPGFGLCSDTAYDFISILPFADPHFAYDPDFYCLGDNDPIPLILGDGGGEFQAISNGTELDSLGRLDLDQSGPGNHVIQYKVGNICPDSLRDTVSINNSVNAFFAYPVSEYCTTDSNPVPQTVLSGGLFAVNMPGLQLDSVSGEIDLLNSLPGLYELSYSFSGSCQTSYSTNLRIRTFPGIPFLNYPADSFCRDSLAPAPVLSTDSIGVFVGSPGLSFLNPIVGSIDLANTSPGGPYYVRYDVANPCAIDPVDSLYILQSVPVSFSYLSDQLCVGAPPLSPVFISPAGEGIWSSTPTGLNLDSGGTVLPGTSLPGNYTISFKSPDFCPVTAFAELSIYPVPQNALLTIEPDHQICAGEKINAQLSASDGVAFSFLLNDQPFDSGFFSTEFEALSDRDKVQGVIENAFACRDTLEQMISILPRPGISTSSRDNIIVENGVETLAVLSNIPDTDLRWELRAFGGIIGSGETELPGTLNLDLGEFSPDPIFYSLLLVPESNGCIGDSIEIQLTSISQPFFVPEVFTPNGDQSNDYWEIRWQDGISGGTYEVIVLNRGGGEVHRMRATDRWDGGNLPDGVYWWLIRDHEGVEIQRGGLTLKRK